jgi:hypothetical protein
MTPVPGADPRPADGEARPDPARRRAGLAWLRRYVQTRVDERLAHGALERALEELRARPEDPE